jgi:FAD binding domain
MVNLRVATLTGPETTLPEAVVEEFKKSLRGELLRPSDETYDLVRQIHNGMIDRHPALIARCTGVADVINAINFARANNLLVSVRGGGHSVPGFAVCDGGIMIDLSRMNSVRVDPVGRTARAEGGATLTMKPMPSAWPPLVVLPVLPALLASPWAVATDSSCAGSA